ncbi:Uncharacterised protein [Mycobacterium tuberculosis]|nr:Uncharacterised protein [Mycobacterium tuberculosis]
MCPHLAQRFPQVPHPAQAHPGRGRQTDHPDRRACIDRRIHQVDQLLSHRTGDRGADALLERGQQLRTTRQRESTHPETDHQQRKYRKDRVVGESGRKKTAVAIVKARERTHDMVQPPEPGPQPVKHPWLGELAHDRLPYPRYRRNPSRS